jgi:2-oxoisovalerate dehydrogenase E2 component (dihydrolipoyl transacylase)
MPQLTMPNIGEGVTEGTVTRWLKAEGDEVALDDPVVEVETDKAVVEIPSPFAGKLAKILTPEGAVVPIGAPLAEFTAESTAAATQPSVEQVRPERGAVPAGRGNRAGPPAAAPSRPSTNGSGGEQRRTRQYSPVVLKLAAEHQVDLSLVRGTGIEGRVTRQDVMRYLENPALYTVAPGAGEGVVGAQKRAAASPAEGVGEKRAAAPVASSPSPPPTEGQVTPLSATRRTIATRMSESHATIPAAWMAVEADVTGLVALRESIKDRFFANEGVKLTYLPFFVQAIVGALRQHPALNATFSDDGITIHRQQHAGIAIATDWGLVVPVIRDAGGRSISGLAREIDALSAKARERKLSVEEMRGATITIDNTGAFGSVLSQPIVPVGQVAILTTEAIRREIRPVGDGFGIRAVMNLCISIDHRAVDGAQAGALMAGVKRRLEAYTPDQTVY